MKSNRKYNASIVLSIVSVLISAVSIFSVYMLSRELQDSQKDTTISIVQTDYKTTKLEFCIDNQLESCDDDTVTDWNEANPDKKFQLKNFEELVETGIDQYNNSKK